MQTFDDISIRRPALADQEIEVGALVGLQHVVDVELPVAAGHGGCGRLPGRQAACQFGIVHMQVQAAGGDIEVPVDVFDTHGVKVFSAKITMNVRPGDLVLSEDARKLG